MEPQDQDEPAADRDETSPIDRLEGWRKIVIGNWAKFLIPSADPDEAPSDLVAKLGEQRGMDEVHSNIGRAIQRGARAGAVTGFNQLVAAAWMSDR